MAEAAIWGIRAGKTGDGDELFLKENCVAIGWRLMGDLKLLKPNREAFKTKFSEMFRDDKPGAVPVNAGQLFRFAHEAQIGDLIAYPSKIDRQIHLGRIESDYFWSGNEGDRFAHRRTVKWLKAFPRTQFSQGALYELNASMTFFQIKNYADEVRSSIEGRLPAVAITDDASVASVAEDIEETTRDFILKGLAQELKGHPFADFIAHLLGVMGYRSRVSPEGPDGGIDIIAHKDELGFEPPIIKVQVKSREGSVGDPEVSALYGKLSGDEFALFFTLGTFSAAARNFARNKAKIRLIDGEELVGLILRHYDKFDSRYKGLIPLKRVFVPELIEEAE